MKIIFKNVGQGDTIIIQWKKLEDNFVGVIDCKKHNTNNPLIDYLIKNQVKKIYFIILSHPHIDHFSGLLELLDYCQSKDIKIKYFLHSLNIHSSYLNWANIDNDSNNLLEKIIVKSVEFYNSQIIYRIGYISLGFNLPLNNEFNLSALSPSDDECRLFMKIVDYFKLEIPNKCSQAANLLSSVLKVHTKESYILLTSDSTKEVFNRFRTRLIEEFKEKLLLCQIPHHGANNNHDIEFWKSLKKELNCPSVISAGNHKKFNHPDYNVVDDYINAGYKIYSTNNVNGNINLFSKSSKSRKLDFVSKVKEKNYLAGDQSFEYIDNKFIKN